MPDSDPASPSLVQTPVIDKRARVRYRCESLQHNRAFISNSSKTLAAQVVDLSRTGVGLLLEAPIEKGTMLLIELGDGSKDVSFELMAEVVYAQQNETGAWRCGCELLREISEDELHLLLQE